MRREALLLTLLLGVCAGCVDSSGGADAGLVNFAAPGRFAVGSAHLSVTSRDGGRQLPVELWYPAEAAAAPSAEEGFLVEEFEAEPRRSQLSAWIQQAPELCTPRRAHSARDAAPATTSDRFPLLVFSHCTECFRFSAHSLAEQLASHGFVIAAPDHVTNTRFDATAPINNDFLSIRADDLASVLDVLLDAQAAQVPDGLRGKLDPDRVAAFGHSYGAVTAGKLVERDDRVRGGFLIAAPVDTPFLNYGGAERVTRPLSYLLAVEDQSISYIGNDFIRDNFINTPRPSWLIEVKEAGHWTFSDIAGLGGAFTDGCGTSTRSGDGGVFTSLDNDLGREIAKRSVTAWAAHLLRDDADATAALSVAEPAEVVKVRRR